MTTSNDWRIHRKLKEAQDEQRMRRMMLLMGRGNGKTRSLVEELETILDHDICSNSPWPMYDLMTNWHLEPKLYRNNYMINDYFNWQLRLYDLLWKEHK